ncbi:MAG: hypothetical protein WCV90_06105 [Candidatus Woesearchaeota archaeon]|jgi:hypothetical protein
MSLDIIIKEFNPILCADLTGKAIACRDVDNLESETMKVYVHPKTMDIRTHVRIAQKYSIPGNLVLGGFEWNGFGEYPRKEIKRYEFSFFSFSTDYGGIPSIVVPQLISAFQTYLDHYDYAKGEEEIARIRFESSLGSERGRRVTIDDEQERLDRQYQKELEHFEKRIVSYSGWWNSRTAKKQGVPLREFVTQKYGLVAPILPEPVFKFTPSGELGKENFFIGEPNINDTYAEDEVNRWIKFLGYDWRKQ